MDGTGEAHNGHGYGKGMMAFRRPISDRASELPARVSRKIAARAYTHDRSPREAITAANCIEVRGQVSVCFSAIASQQLQGEQEGWVGA